MRLIEAAERLFIRKGFDDASVEEISEMAGYSRGAFYSNFDNKEQVFLAVIDQRRPKALDDILRQASEPAERIAAVREWFSNQWRHQGFHRPPNGVQPQGDERSFCAEAPRRTASAGTRNILRFGGPVSSARRRESGSPAGNRRACAVGRCPRPGKSRHRYRALNGNRCTRRQPGWHSTG